MNKLLLCVFIAASFGTIAAFSQEQDSSFFTRKKKHKSQVSTFNPFQKGNFFVGANASFSPGFTFADENSYFNFDLALTGGYFLANNFSVSVLLGAAALALSEKNSEGRSIRKSSFGIAYGLSAAYYYKNFFITAGYALQNSTLSSPDSTGYDRRENTNSSNILASIGYVFFLGKRWALTPSLNYNHIIRHEDGVGSINTLNIGIGLNYFIFKNKK